MAETLGASFSIDVTNLKAGLAQANRLIKESESEFRAAAAGMDDWTQSEEGLNAKIASLNSITEVQRKKVDALQTEYDNLIANGLDPASKEAVELRTKINNETTALNKNEAELKKQTQALEELGNEEDEAGDAAGEMGDKFSGLKAAGGIAVGAIAAIGAACAGAVAGFLGLAESTREARNNMAKVETAFQSAGLSAENAADTMTTLYGIMGDEGAAGEAAQQLAKISKSEADLEANTRILTGVMAEYGASIPTEGLAEGMAATAAMGEVQGVLADALEWQGVNLEDYNAKLATLATEEERAAYIQSTLTDLYGASADAYRENNAEIIAAQEAQMQLNDALNTLGAIAEPIMTTLKTVAADLLTSIMPFVELIGEGLTGALNGSAGATDTFAQGISGLLTALVEGIAEMLPSVLQTITTVATTLLPQIVSAVAAIFPQLVTTIAQQLPVILQAVISGFSQIVTALGEMLPELIPVIIDAVLMIVETLIDNIDQLIDAGIALIIGLADGLIQALPQLIEKIPVIIDKLITAITNNLPKILKMGVELTVKLAAGLIQAIPQLISKIPQIITSIVNGLKNGISKIKEVGSDIIKGLWNGIKDMGSWIAKKIKGFGEDVLGGLKSFFGIKSPSRVMRDEVGKPIVQGIAQGIEKNSKLAVNALEDTSEKMLASELLYLSEKERIEKEKAEKELAERLANAKDAAEIEKIKQEEINKAAEAATEKYLENLKAKAEAERKEYEAIIEAEKKAYEELQKSREAVASKLFNEANDTYNTIKFITGDDSEEFYVLPDMKQQNKDLIKYNDLLDELIVKYGTLPQEVIENLEAMTVEDGIKYVTAMLNASEEAWNEYVTSFAERQDIAAKIGQALFPDEAINNVQQTATALVGAVASMLETTIDDSAETIATSVGKIKVAAEEFAAVVDGGNNRNTDNGGATVNQYNYFKQAYTSRFEQYKSNKQLQATVRQAIAGA